MKKVCVFLGIIAAFGAGFGSGILATKKKYEKRSDDEIQSVKDAFQKHLGELSSKNIPPTRRGQSKKKKEQEKKQDKTVRTNPLPNDPVMDDYIDYAAPYHQTSKTTKQPETKDHQNKLEPYIISPDEYMASEYGVKTLIYYADKVLADDDDNVIPNPTTLLGSNALKSFGQYEDDCVYVRDDNLKTDYEVLLSQKTFNEEVSKSENPKQALQTGDVEDQ